MLGVRLSCASSRWSASKRWRRAATSAASSPAAGGAWSGGGCRRSIRSKGLLSEGSCIAPVHQRCLGRCVERALGLGSSAGKWEENPAAHRAADRACPSTRRSRTWGVFACGSKMRREADTAAIGQSVPAKPALTSVFFCAGSGEGPPVTRKDALVVSKQSRYTGSGTQGGYGAVPLQYRQRSAARLAADAEEEVEGHA